MAQEAYKPSEADRKTVRALAAYGIPQERIGEVVGCSHVTLRKHYRRELDLAATEANAKVAETLFRLATSGKDVAATIFWCKTRLGWREVTRHEHGGDEAGGPIKIVISPTDSKL